MESLRSRGTGQRPDLGMKKSMSKRKLQATEDYSQALKSTGDSLVRFQNGLEARDSFLSLIFPPSELGRYITVVLCLFHHCILEADHLFPSFTNLEMS